MTSAAPSTTSSSSSSSPSSRPESTRNCAYERHSHTLSDPASDSGDRSTNPVTLTRFLQAEHAQFPSSTGRFTMLLQSIQLAVKVIAAATRKAGIGNLYGLAGESNSSGDQQKKLDIFANDAMINCLTSATPQPHIPRPYYAVPNRTSLTLSLVCGAVYGSRYSEQVSVLVSEEEDHPLIIDSDGDGYAVAFDPLDGSSNIDCNVRPPHTFPAAQRTLSSAATHASSALRCAPGSAVRRYDLRCVLAEGVVLASFLLDDPATRR